ncbi:MAG: sensor histidine kinase [Burkholderiales bacterium]
MPQALAAAHPARPAAQRRAALRVEAGAAARTDPGAFAHDALDALGQWHASIDPSRSQLEWCSTALSTAFPQWSIGATIAELESGFPGIAALIALQADASAQGVATAPDGRPLRVQSAPGRDGRLYLRLSDLWADGESAARHLSDRERLLFVSRSMSVGEMASILAHELNQPIGSIANLLRGVALRLDSGTGDAAILRPAIAQGIEQAMYAAGILARVREYVEPRQPRRDVIALPALVAAAIALLDWEVRRDGIAVSLVDLTEPCQGRVAGDPVMLQQVVVNLARNAIEAMRGMPGAERSLQVETALDDDMVVLRISDRGCGIDPQAEARLFTPFFTTKPDGTGLGLHVCRSIVELHQGRLWFDTSAERGCTVCVALPVLPPRDDPETLR